MITTNPGDRSRLILATSGQISAQDQNAGSAIRLLCLDAAEAVYGALPPSARAFEPFETVDGLVSAEATRMGDIDAWSLRYSEPDPNVPGRSSVLETTCLIEADKALFSCRVTLFSKDMNFDLLPETPQLLKDTCAGFIFGYKGFAFAPNVQEIGTDISVTALLHQLVSPDRWWNCIVVSTPEHGAPGMDPGRVHAGVAGCANTFLLPEHHELEFAAAVGYDFNVVKGGARMYRPGFDALSSEITAHPVTRAPLNWDDDGADQSMHAMRADAFRVSVERSEIRYRAPGFATIRQIASQKRSDKAQESGDSATRIEALKRLVAAERNNVDEAVALAIQSDEERQLAQAALENEQALNYGLKMRIKTLESSLDALGGQTDQPDPTEYAQIKSWVAESFSGQLRLTPRADKGLRSAVYEKIEDVVAGLRLLADPYRRMKTGTFDPLEFEQQCRALGFEETRSVSRITAGQKGDAYFVTYAGKKCFLDRHLKKGTSKDPRYCLRIYFFWDAEAEMVVVGSLPEHLSTSSK